MKEEEELDAPSNFLNYIEILNCGLLVSCTSVFLTYILSSVIIILDLFKID